MNSEDENLVWQILPRDLEGIAPEWEHLFILNIEGQKVEDCKNSYIVGIHQNRILVFRFTQKYSDAMSINSIQIASEHEFLVDGLLTGTMMLVKKLHSVPSLDLNVALDELWSKIKEAKPNEV